MKKPGKRTRRGLHYRALAEGYKAMNFPLAASLDAAAEHYDHTDLPLDPVVDPHETKRDPSSPLES
jgi:hypothetical protein